MKYLMLGSVAIFICFSIYVAVVNRHSKKMTLKQKVLKAVYPVFVWYSGKTAKGKLVLSGNVAAPFPFYSLSDTLVTGQIFSFEKLKGKKILLVNTASDCGYTGQYEDLEKLSRLYRDKLAVIGFPSNDFNEQEKGNDNAIATFCKLNYGVSFPLMKKNIVSKLPGQNKIYRWLSDETQNGWNTQTPSWNFCKYLIDENGRLTHFFGPAIQPMGKEIEKALQ